jgi:hypothetical protein
VQSGSNGQQQLKFVDRMSVVSTETQTPNLEQSFQIQKHGKGYLQWNGTIYVSPTVLFNLLTPEFGI